MACEVIVAHQISAQITDSKATASKLKKMMLMFMLGGPCAFIVLAMAFGLGGFWFGFIAWILGLFFYVKPAMVKMAKGSVQGNVDVVKNEAKKIMHSLGFEVTHEFSNGFFNFDAKNKKFLSVVLDKSQFHLYDFDDLRGISIEQFATAQDRHNAKMSSLAQDMKRSSAINSAVSNAVDGATGRSRISAGISNDMAGIAVQASAHAAHGAGYNSARKAIGNIGVPTGGNIIVLSTNNPDSPIYKTIGLADQEAERTYHTIMALTSV